MANNGDFLLRIEDIDTTRARPEWEVGIYEDLSWLGLWWPEPVMRQSERQDIYDNALDALWQRGLLYACTCSRADVAAAASAPQEGVPTHGPDGLIYPGTCRGSWKQQFSDSSHRPGGVALRLDIGAACRSISAFHSRTTPGKSWASSAFFTETGAGPEGETGLIEFTPNDMKDKVGDIVVARRDFATSYHLSVVLDDAAQGITHVVRGQDLFEATKIHVVLQHLLGLPTPIYHHHRLIRDEQGKRLAKRDDARAIRTYRDEGVSPDEIRSMIGL